MGRGCAIHPRANFSIGFYDIHCAHGCVCVKFDFVDTDSTHHPPETTMFKFGSNTTSQESAPLKQSGAFVPERAQAGAQSASEVTVLRPNMLSVTRIYTMNHRIAELRDNHERTTDGSAVYMRVHDPEAVGAALAGPFRNLASIPGTNAIKGHIVHEIRVVHARNGNRNFGIGFTPVRLFKDAGGKIREEPFCPTGFVDSLGRKSTYPLEAGTVVPLSHEGYVIYAQPPCEKDGSIDTETIGMDLDKVEKECIEITPGDIPEEHATIDDKVRLIPARSPLVSTAINAWKNAFTGEKALVPEISHGYLPVAAQFFDSLMVASRMIQSDWNRRTTRLEELAIKVTRLDGKNFAINPSSAEYNLPIEASLYLQIKYVDLGELHKQANGTEPVDAVQNIDMPVSYHVRKRLMEMRSNNASVKDQYIKDLAAAKQSARTTGSMYSQAVNGAN